MEAPEEVMGSNDHTNIVKGKRTKRVRLSSPLAVAMTASSSSAGGGGGDDDYAIPSPMNLAEIAAAESSTEEEEDMANCLILLAQGESRNSPRRIEDGGGAMERYSNRRFAEAATTTMGKAGFYVYECKTCNRCFPSFQALGGHRASHKRPKAMVEGKKLVMFCEDESQFNKNSPPLALQIGNRVPCSNHKSRVHECSICGSEFLSGQALGGHMRRHRTSTGSTAITTMTTITSDESQETPKKQRNVLTLDLNLPAPEDDRDTKFPFTSKQQPLVFSASALVDCHY